MGRRLQLQVPRTRGKWLRNMERRVIHISTGLHPAPHYRHLFERGRGELTTNGIHLNPSLRLSNQPGPPHTSSALTSSPFNA